jgi:hypothetical protein
MTEQKKSNVIGMLSLIASVGAFLSVALLALGEDRSSVERHERQIPELMECSKKLEIQVEVLKEMLPRIERKVDAIDAKLNNRGM